MIVLMMKPNHNNSKRRRLTELCCATIAMNKELFKVEELKSRLPAELFEVCFEHKTSVTITDE